MAELNRVRQLLRRLVPALIVGLVCAWLPHTLPGRRVELLGFDLLTMLTAPARIDAPIVIVGIDDPSFTELSRAWPWPRTLHARLVDALKSAGAAVIAFDVLFPEASVEDDDRQFATAIRRAGNVVLASDLVYQESGQYQQVIEVEPLALLREAGARRGMASVSLDADLIVRTVPMRDDAFWREVVRAYSAARGGDATRGDASPRQMMRYLGPDHAFPYVSFYQALDPGRFLPAETFRDKIVLIGNDVKAALGPKARDADAFATPYSGVTRLLTPGVEIHATLIANALARRGIAEAPQWAQFGVIAVVVLLMTGFGAGEWRALRSGLLAAGLVGATLGGALWLFAARDLWLPSIGAALAVAGMYGTSLATEYLWERRQRRRVERAFRFYVAPEIVREMTEHPERLVLGGVRREITILFTDLAGFTSISERMRPEQVAELLNGFLTIMTRIVLNHGGTVDKFIGDAIMAFWGAPLADPEQALHACHTAMAMQAAMSRLRGELAGKQLPELRMRIGVHSGSAVVGNMGSEDRFDYTAIGDNVNLASRLEGANKHFGTETLISGETAAQLAKRIALRRVDRVVVKGKTQPIDIFTLCDDAELVALSERAVSHYLRRDWESATRAYREILDRHPADTIAPVLIERIESLRRDPPPADWNGGTPLDKL